MKAIDGIFDAVKRFTEGYLEISTFSEERKEKIRTFIDNLEQKVKT